ncbi:MAG: SDR family oxidoreductase [Ferruginibacter sp.]|nr:SDR family oxidoreductase [Bacteroidota bacterium]MBX2919692.1 SDR family oxidoreductase [Ferruginibacter sp.]MCB0710196.1 SDR family oxidoreductase [Chitinophagaceae bacterium]MCC7378534.1 SDR family oxidoreductase [Chitinophagaceae bacterium]
MKLIVFGATGMVGKMIVQQALYMGHHVKAFGRNVYTTDYLQTDNLELVKGALFSEAEVFDAIQGCDAVLSAIGGAADGTDKARTLGMKNIIKQMQKLPVKRIVAIGGMGVLNASENSLLIDEKDYPKQYIPVGKEHQKAYELLKESSLNWTFVCPPDIINAGPTGNFTTAADYPPVPNNYKINAGDLAMFMLNELKKNEYIKLRVGISN